MKKDLFSYRAAACLSLVITVLMHSFFGLVFLFGRNAMMSEGAPEELSHQHGPEMGWEWMTISLVSVFIFSFLMFLINFWVLKAELKHHRLLAILTASIVGTIMITYSLLHIQIYLLNIDFGDSYNRMVLGNMMKDFLLTIIIIFTSQILYLSHKKQQMALENERLMAENAKSRYEALKNQVDPHFLFNTLNTLNTMIKVDPDKAQEYVQKMSSVFRYTLQHREKITLEEELQFTRDYCLLMQIRYGDSLIFQFDVAREYYPYHIIPLSVQTLVENAIKHNVISKRQPLTVTISTGEDDTLCVSNLLQVKKEAEPGEGIGLANLTERYRLRFGREVEVMCNDAAFQVTIPLIKPAP